MLHAHTLTLVVYTHTYTCPICTENKCSKKCNPWSGGDWGELCFRVVMRKSGKHCSSGRCLHRIITQHQTMHCWCRGPRCPTLCNINAGKPQASTTKSVLFQAVYRWRSWGLEMPLMRPELYRLCLWKHKARSLCLPSGTPKFVISGCHRESITQHFSDSPKPVDLLIPRPCLGTALQLSLRIMTGNCWPIQFLWTRHLHYFICS